MKSLNQIDGTDLIIAEATIKTVAEKHGVTPEQIKGPRRGSEYVKARREIAIILREHYSYPAIGLLMGRDHASIINLIHLERKRARWSSAVV